MILSKALLSFAVACHFQNERYQGICSFVLRHTRRVKENRRLGEPKLFPFSFNSRSDFVPTYYSWFIVPSERIKFVQQKRSHIPTETWQPTPKRCHFVKWFFGGDRTDTPTDILPRKCKMRSKFWWLTGFCNSHDVSHFAAFFIVVGAKTSVAESGLTFRSSRFSFRSFTR